MGPSGPRPHPSPEPHRDQTPVQSLRQRAARLAALSALALAILLIAAGPAPASVVHDIRVVHEAEHSRAEILLSDEPAYQMRNASLTEGRVSIQLTGIRHGPFAVRGEASTHIRTVDIQGDPRREVYLIHLNTSGEAQVDHEVLRDPWRLVVQVRSQGAASPGASAPVPILGPQAAPPSASPTPAPPQLRPPTVAPNTPAPSAGGFKPRIIVIDAGHGGRHRGGVGTAHGRPVDEAMATLPLAFELERLLRADPLFRPEMTRRRDEYISLRERTRRAEQFGGHMFISIHYNSVPPGSSRSARGFEIYTWSPREADTVAGQYLQQLDNEEGSSSDLRRANPSARPILNQMMMDALVEQAWESVRVASAMERAFVQDPYFRRHNRGLKTGRFKVLENYSMPSILVEVAFISNPEEAVMALDPAFQRRVAQLMYNGIVRYYEETDPAFRAARAARMSAGR